ncbi:MAG: hypothetical protein F4X84_00460 [Synechococcus sp. SB0662_bin_45]|nr:hypothetical protein [Synechococcus sp. SB0662_bin_45]
MGAEIQPAGDGPASHSAGRICSLTTIINHKGKIVAFKITDGSRDDRQPLAALTAALQGKILPIQAICPSCCWSASGNGAFTWSPGHLVTGSAAKGRTLCCPCWTRCCPANDSASRPSLRCSSPAGAWKTRHRWPINALVHRLSCLAATTLAQPRINIGNIAIPNTMHTIPTSYSPYPQLGLDL